MSTESGSFASARTVVQLYLDNKDLGQVTDGGHDGDRDYNCDGNDDSDDLICGRLVRGRRERLFSPYSLGPTSLQ